MKYLTLIFLLARMAAFADPAYDQFQAFEHKVKPFRPGMEVFANGKGQYIAQAPNFSDEGLTDYLGDNFFYCEDLNCHQMHETGFGGTYNSGTDTPKVAYHAGFKDARLEGLKYDENGLFRKDDEIKSVCGNVKSEFKKVDGVAADRIREQARMIPIPEVRDTEYFVKIPSTGEVIYISADKNNYSYQSYKLYKGKPGQLKEFKITGVQRYRDGGTTIIKSDIGTLFFPNGGAANGRPPSWTLPDKHVISITPVSKPVPQELAAAIGNEMLNERQEKPLRTFCDIPSANRQGGIAQPGAAK